MKNPITKKRLIYLILVVSLFGNAWYFGGQWFAKEKQKAFNQGVITVFQTAQKNGQVQMTLDNKVIKLILISEVMPTNNEE